MERGVINEHSQQRADAVENLDELIDRVLKNETITITRDAKILLS